MTSYRDMTFCAANCLNQSCHRQFTEDHAQRALNWWGNENYPVAYADFSATCDEYQPEDSE